MPHVTVNVERAEPVAMYSSDNRLMNMKTKRVNEQAVVDLLPRMRYSLLIEGEMSAIAAACHHQLLSKGILMQVSPTPLAADRSCYPAVFVNLSEEIVRVGHGDNLDNEKGRCASKDQKPIGANENEEVDQ